MMLTTHRKNWRLALWVSFAVTGILTALVLAALHPHKRNSQDRALRFGVPAADKTTEAAFRRVSTASTATYQLMTLDPTRKYLVNSGTQKPVFITGESAWSLQAQLSDPDIEAYLSDRATRGFNAIWVGLVDNTYSNHPPMDFYGNVPFSGADFTNENEVYWSHVDHTLQRAAAYGITVLADPAFVGYGCRGGYCQSYRNSSTDVLTAYGQFLGNRYKGFPNIIWVIGGDADPADSNVQSKLTALASGIKSVDTVHLMTTENYRGTSSADIWSGATWLDLDALYLQPTNIPAKANAAYLAARHPVFMLEDWYEGEHSMTELGVRKEGYLAVLSGSTVGRIFGNYAIWNFTWTKNTKDPWKAQFNSLGSVGQSWLGKLFRSREHWKLVPDSNHSVLISGYDRRSLFTVAKDSLRSFISPKPISAGNMLSVAARTSDGQTIIAYVPSGNGTTVAIDMGKITDSQSKAKCWWFNPRDGSNILIGNFVSTGTRNFTPPDVDDWVLVIDSATENLAAPGTKDL